MKTNSKRPVLATNQNSGMKMDATAGTSIAAASAKNTTAAANSAGATKFEPNSVGNNGCQPPRNRTVVIEATVIMLAYSAMKNAANFMLLYSVWKPATSSVSASGRSNGMRFVSAKAAMIKMMKLKIWGNGPWRMFQFQ